MGEIVPPGKAIGKIANLKIMKVKGYVSGDQLRIVKIGNNVKVLVDSENGKLFASTGVVTKISDKAEFTPKVIQTKKELVNLVYAIEICIDNKGEYKIGMPAEIVF